MKWLIAVMLVLLAACSTPSVVNNETNISAVDTPEPEEPVEVPEPVVNKTVPKDVSVPEVKNTTVKNVTIEPEVCECDCPDASDCSKECKSDIEAGCELGGVDCREYCDPHISAWECRDNCEESTSLCIKNLAGLCQTTCQNKESNCLADCECT